VTSGAGGTYAVVTVSAGDTRGPDDRERTVRSLDELFEACREAPPSKLVRVTLRSEDGEVRLHFASFQRRR
jgi:hypothetical protein